jgi:MFS family permease
VVGVSATVSCLAWSVRSTFALFYVALLGEFAWSRGEAAIGYSLSWLLLVVFSPLCGWLYDRWGARSLVPVGGLVLGAALALTGQSTTLWHYALAFGVLGAAGIASIQMPAAAIVSRWFVRSRGAALGVVSAGAKTSVVIFYPLNTWLIITLGWRAAFVVFALIVALVTVPLASLLYRDRPDIDGQRENSPEPETEPRGVAVTAADWTLGAALRSVSFWAVCAMWCLGVIGYQIVTTHQVAHAVDRGFSPLTLGWVFALGGACTVAGNLLGGALSDRWGREWVFTLGSAIGIAGIGCLGWLEGAADLPLLLLYAASGVGFGMWIALLTAIPADLFAGPHFGAILGAANGSAGLGGFIGPLLGGWLFDITGSYQLSFAVAALAIAGSAGATWVAAPRKSRSAQVLYVGANDEP